MKTLEEKTMEFWHISQLRYSRLSEGDLTVEAALTTMRYILDNTSPHRPLARCTSNLSHSVVLDDDLDRLIR